MIRGVQVSDDTYWVGTNDYVTTLFESIWPLPLGVAYNAYLIADEKTALIDAVKKDFASGLLDNLESRLGPAGQVDYLVVNHMEPDHSGAIRVLRRVFPEMTIVGNSRTAEFLSGFYDLIDNIRVVGDGDELDLGTHKLRFHLTPMVHWPETMMTYDLKTKVLFTGDAFGGFGALPGGIFDDEVDLGHFEAETLRYFTNIVGKFGAMVRKAIDKVRYLDIAVVAPTHGPVWRARPREIIEKYDAWARQETIEGAVIVYGSMYGNTETMAQSVARGLAEAGVEKVRLHNVSRTHSSFILNDIWRFRAFAFGAPTYNVRLFPPVDDFLRLLTNVPLRDRLAGVFGTYGWTGGGVRAIREYCEQGKYDLVEPVVEARCAPTETDLEACRQLGRNLASALRGEKVRTGAASEEA
ncbi:MAG: FprA family A-type flavoprotein [Planctomycetota bacterium]|jgi:flavorubredoxin